MSDFELGDIVITYKLLYEYKDYPWLTLGLTGWISKELETNNKRGAKRFQVAFPSIQFSARDKSTPDICYANLYSDELLKKDEIGESYVYHFDLSKGKENDEMENMKKYSSIITNFYLFSRENIEKKYENKRKIAKNKDFLQETIYNMKKELSKQLQCPLNNIKVQYFPENGPVILEENIVSSSIKEQLETLDEQQQEELHTLKRLCDSAQSVIQYGQDFDDICYVLKSYGILDSKCKISEIYGLEKSETDKE